MNKTIRLLILALLAVVPTLRAEKVEEAIAANFFQPEQVIKYVDILNLTEEQKTKLRDAHEKAQQKGGELKEQQQAEAAKFNELAKQAHVDEKAITAQGEKYLDAEREIRRQQLALLVLIKNTLLPEQQAVLTAIKALDPKIAEVKKIAEKWKTDGRSLDKLEGAKEKFDAALQSGRIKDAAAIVDQALDILNERGGK